MGTGRKKKKKKKKKKKSRCSNSLAGKTTLFVCFCLCHRHTNWIICNCICQNSCEVRNKADVYLAPRRTHRNKNSRLATTHTNQQPKTDSDYMLRTRTISTHSQRKRRTVNKNPRTSATQPSPNWTRDTTPLGNPPSTIFSVFNRIQHLLQRISATPMPHAPQHQPTTRDDHSSRIHRYNQHML
jgi:hypothetical protein